VPGPAIKKPDKRINNMSNALQDYLQSQPSDQLNAEMVALLASLTSVAKTQPDVARSIVKELADQRSYLKLIASENYSSLQTQLAMGNWLTDKYAEGFAHNRFYEGCDNVDYIEALACDEAKKLFGAEHAFVQPHSGADANMVAFWGILQARIQMPALAELDAKTPDKLSDEDWESIRTKLGNQKIMGLDLACGGHLTHGYRHNVSGKMFQSHTYKVSEKDNLLDYDQIEAMALEVKPLILIAGYSAYPRKISFKRMREIADKVGAVLMVDMAHFAGLVAGKVFTGDFSPFPHAHVVTSTTHKTLRGPRGGIILANEEFGPYMDKGCPLVLGGPLPHVMAAKAVAFTEANKPEFQAYAQSVVDNAQALAAALQEEGLTILTGGTENHLMLIDVTSMGITGRQAASALRDAGITLNKNGIPFDKLSPMITSGLRIGTPAITSLGMGVADMKQVASIIKKVLAATKPGLVEKGPNAGKVSKIAYTLDEGVRAEAKTEVGELLSKFLLYPEIDLAYLEKAFG
jgi:glycine hydroxymethyltransferase